MGRLMNAWCVFLCLAGDAFPHSQRWQRVIEWLAIRTTPEDW